MEEAVKQVTPLIPTEPDWPYTLVQLSGDACHMPLPMEGHLSIMVEGSTSNVTCRRISQLEVHQLLSSGSQVIYSAELNGYQVPLVTSLLGSLAKGATLLGGKPAPLPVDILQSTRKEKEPKVPPFGSHSSHHPNCKPHQGSPSQGGRAGQHDHGGERALIPGGTGYLWASIREFHPKVARSHGLSHTSTS